MKHNLTLRRGLCVLLSLLMCLSLLPAAVLADEPAATADFTADANAALALLNAAKTEGSADSTWENNTLTLNGVDFTTSAGTAVKLPAGAKIVLAEGTTNTIASAADNADMSYGIYAAGDLTIEGSGTLIVRSAKATPSSNDGESYGIYANNGDITISGGTIEATGGKSYATDYSIGISGRNVIISGGTVTAKGGQESGGNYGIYADVGLVKISGGVVTATGNTADFGSYGIYAISVVISGGHVIARTLISKSAENQAALVTPDLSAYTGYYWRTSSGTSFTQTAYTYSETDTYVEFSSQSTVTTYTVTFDANGGELTEGSKTFIKTEADGTVVYLAAATREGYTFDGWYTAATGGEKVYTFINTFTADTVLYAHWIPAADTQQITEFTMEGYTLGANPKNIRLALNTEGLSLIGGYFEAYGKPFSYVLGEAIDGDPNYVTEVTGPLEAGKAYILLVKVDINTGYETSALTADAVTLNGAIKAFDCDADVIGEACASFLFILPALTENGTPDVKYTVTVIGSNASVTGAGEYKAGDTVTLAAGSIINFIFSGWTSDDVIISDVYSADTSFVMPEKDVTVTANWIYNGIIIIPGGGSSGGSTTPTYPPVVEQPTEGGSVDTSTDKPIAGDNVTVTPTPDEGYEVDEVIVTDQNGNPVEITDNGDSTTFSPDEPCTRAQVVAFLWRAAGCPTPNSTEMPFTDVVEGSYYETAVLWAVENGITLGTNAEGTLFSPDAVCSRAQIVTFLYRCLSNK